MRGIARIAILGIAGLATWPATSQEMKVVETDGLEIIFQSPAADYLIPYTIQTFENGLAAQRRLFDYVPDGKPALMLRDFTDRGNAMIATAPRNRIYYDVAPMNLVFETFSPGERMYTIANHETVHLVTSDQAGPTEKRARRWFGGKVGPVAEHPETLLYYYLTTPRNATPRWYSEGSATFMETWYGGGLGRAQGGYDEMVFRAMVRDGARFYDPLGLVSEGTEVDFQTGANAYLYGTRFMSYLALKYTPEKLIEWWRLDEGSQRYYERDFEQVFGLPLPQAWQDWIAWEHEFQRANLASVRQHPITPYREITRKGLGAISQSYLSSDRRELYAAVRYPGRVPYLVAIRLDDGSVRELVEIKSAMAYRVTSLAYDPASETLFYTEDNGSLRDLMAYDIKTDKSRLLIEDGRIGDLSFNRADGSLWGLRTNNGFVMIVRMAPPYTEWKALHVYPFGEVPFDLDVSRDGKLVSLSLAGPDGERSGMQVMQVRVMSSEKLLAGDATPLHRFEMGTALPESFTFSDDGRYLFGSSYYTGVSNIYRYDLEQRKLEALSNAESGFFRPLPLDQDEMIVFHYAADGFVPAIIEPRPTEDLSAITFLGEQVATQRPVVQGWGAGPPSQVDYVAATLREETYSPWRKLSRESVYPVVEGYKDSVGFGAHARFSDPIGFQSLALTASYSPDSDLESKERLHASIDFRHYLWKAGVRWNAGDFYDLFGPTKRSREGWSVYVENEKPLVYDPPETLSIVTKLAYFGDLDSLPNFQNVPSPTDRLGEASVALHYRHPRASVGHVDDEAGYLWSVGAHLYETEGEFTPSLLARFDAGLPLPLGHSSLWLRTAGGVASGDIDDPLANAYFGGFRNNYVDNGEPKRYREPLSMPGFEIDALNGRSFGKAMLEWNLPPLRFDGLGSPGFFGKWLRPAVFATGLVTNPDRDEERVEAYNVGLQFDLNLQVLHRLPMMLSVGYARGFEGDGQGEDEFMLSLKVL